MAPAQEERTLAVDAKDLRRMHHAEIVVFTKDEEGPGGSGMLYNTISLTDEVPDEEFDAQFRALDPEALAKEFNADVVWMNGPRRCVLDRLKITVPDNGKTTMVGPIPMQTIGTMRLPDLNGFLASEKPPYTEMTVGRSTEEFFSAGQQVYQLVSPSGDVCCMYSASLKVDPDNTPDRIATLGERLNQPEGWEYRAPTLEKDLVVRALRGGASLHLAASPVPPGEIGHTSMRNMEVAI